MSQIQKQIFFLLYLPTTLEYCGRRNQAIATKNTWTSRTLRQQDTNRSTVALFVSVTFDQRVCATRCGRKNRFFVIEVEPTRPSSVGFHHTHTTDHVGSCRTESKQPRRVRASERLQSHRALSLCVCRHVQSGQFTLVPRFATHSFAKPNRRFNNNRVWLVESRE